MMGDNHWPYGIDRSKARDAHALAEAASVDAVPFNHRILIWARSVCVGHTSGASYTIWYTFNDSCRHQIIESR